MKTTISPAEEPSVDEFLAQVLPDSPEQALPLDPETFILDPVERWAVQQAAAAPPLPASAERTVVGLMRQHL
ncbi:hypothetical protein [Leucobacter aridicollis]|uniref:Uncharacterized protein n=1 Tax=Leucobacter aridicollis TaxID=283878 RepID=A0A852R2S2_9MICO|nr:hypothetical protein [Leucobacter aridicollis]MBL3681987.1 hypothetical protein [Leucobacter aridicollis]NYD26967.1 hypothetical protein [Leucobacter aridicollis]